MKALLRYTLIWENPYILKLIGNIELNFYNFISILIGVIQITKYTMYTWMKVPFYQWGSEMLKSRQNRNERKLIEVYEKLKT